MKTSARLLLVSILWVVLVAPPAHSQDQKVLLNNLTTDVLNVKNTLKQMQESSDQKNAEMTRLIQEVLSRFTTIEASVQRMNDSLAGIRASDEKSAKDLQVALDALKKNVDEGLTSLQNRFGGLTRQINEMKTTEQPLPVARDVFNAAFGEFSSGFYDLAIGDFKEFIKNYANDVRASAAAFYIGEALFAQEKFDQAGLQYDMVLANYPNSDKKCSALYRKGQTLVEQKQLPQAKTAFDTVVKECPGTQEAANATADLKKLPKPRG